MAAHKPFCSSDWQFQSQSYFVTVIKIWILILLPMLFFGWENKGILRTEKFQKTTFNQFCKGMSQKYILQLLICAPSASFLCHLLSLLSHPQPSSLPLWCLPFLALSPWTRLPWTEILCTDEPRWIPACIIIVYLWQVSLIEIPSKGKKKKPILALRGLPSHGQISCCFDAVCKHKKIELVFQGASNISSTRHEVFTNNRWETNSSKVAVNMGSSTLCLRAACLNKGFVAKKSPEER